MKKIVMLLFSVVIMTTIDAKEKKDPVVMTVAGNDILLSEFIYTAAKDKGVDFNNKKSVENYLELFKNYKLKVADAEALTISKAPKFIREMENYKSQLQESFLMDKSKEDSVLHVIYSRTKYIPGFKQILFRFPGGEILPKDTVEAYKNAMDAYNRIKGGESFESVGESLSEGNDGIGYTIIEKAFPLRYPKVIEDKVFSMKVGEMSMPVRSPVGFHIIKMEKIIPDPGKVRVAHILTRFASDTPSEEEKEATLKLSDSIYQRAMAGEDFEELAKKHSEDTITGKNGGLLSFFGIGVMIESFEKAAFALETPGNISKPVQTRHGYHVIKLIEYKPEIPFEEVAGSISHTMKNTDRHFELYKGFDEKMKERHGYIFYQEAYEELQRLADEYFPMDTNFYYRGMEMEKPLISLDSMVFFQNQFVLFVSQLGASTKTLSIDFMSEMFDIFIRNIVTEMERDILERDYPEYNMQVKGFYDGTLVYELSNKRVWSFPLEEQDKLDAEWIKELNEKYPVTINKKVVKNIKKYLN